MKITFNVSDAMLIANYCMEMYYKNKWELDNVILPEVMSKTKDKK